MDETEPRPVSPKTHQRLRDSRFNRQMTRLGELLALYRAVHHQSVRECAEQIGVHFSTLNRLERSDSGITAENFVKILAWLLQPRTTQPRV
jgi:transcriptional regulator with XRE-family HTH domain